MVCTLLDEHELHVVRGASPHFHRCYPYPRVAETTVDGGMLLIIYVRVCSCDNLIFGVCVLL